MLLSIIISASADVFILILCGIEVHVNIIRE